MSYLDSNPPHPLYTTHIALFEPFSGSIASLSLDNSPLSYSWVLYSLTSATSTWSDATYIRDNADSIVYDIVERITAQTFNTLGIASSFDLSVDLTCSSSGGTAITFAIAQYNSEPIPTWVNINGATSKLTGTTPNVTSTTTYNFLINASSAAWTGTKLKQITLVVNCYTTCEVAN